MDDAYEEIKIIKNIEPENIIALKRNDFDENEDKSPNKIIQKNAQNFSDFTEKKNNNSNILNINSIIKQNNNIFESKNEFIHKNKGNNNYEEILSNNKEDDPSFKLSRKNSTNNKSKDKLNNYNQLKSDLIPNLKNILIKSKNKVSKNKKSIKKDDMTGFKKQLISKYQKHINFVKKKNFFIILFILGILLSSLDLILSVSLSQYGNVEILSIYIVLNIIMIFFYAIGIYFLEKNKIYTYNIIFKLEAPQKIEFSLYHNCIYLLIYFLIFAVYYYLMIMIGLSGYKNNAKLDIKSRAYDKSKWRYFFQNRSYDKVLNFFDKLNIITLISGWCSYTLLLVLIIIFIYYFKSYQFWKRIFQALSFLLGQTSFLLLNMSSYCFQFRHITHLDEYKLNWVIIGLITLSCIGVFMSALYFYIFYTENLKLIKIFNYVTILLIISCIIFARGAKAFGSKFEDYTKASCNTIFKFISEDYLIKNNDCNTKYLFSEDSLYGIKCPKERIMINWEETEAKIKNNEKNNLIFGCINQYCCLKIYGKLKNGFNVQEILAFSLLFLYIILFISSKYIQKKIDGVLDEEIIEKFNLLILIGFNLAVYIICFIIILSRPSNPKQNILNDIEVEEFKTEDSFINKNWIFLSDKNELFKESNKLFDELIKNKFNKYDLDIIANYSKDIFQFDFFEYNISSYNLSFDILNNNNDIIFDYEKIYQNDTNMNIINFKSKNLLINSLNTYFNFSQNIPFQPINTIIINSNLIYSLKKDINDIPHFQNNQKSDITEQNKLIITDELILENYNQNTNRSQINIISNIELSLLNNEQPILDENISSFYIKGNIYNDSSSSLINIYNLNFSNIPLISQTTDNNGEFSIGPFYTYKNPYTSYELTIEIYKILKETNMPNIPDINYNNYSTILTIGGYGFNMDEFYPVIKNISIPLKLKKEYKIHGSVYNLKDDSTLEGVNVKLYKGNKIFNIKSESYISDENLNLIGKTYTDKHGFYDFIVNENGFYTLIFMNDDYFFERENFIINNHDIDIKKKGMMDVFNSGKIFVKLEWDDNPPDLDLICRFEVNNCKLKNIFCYTFFGNSKCVDTHFFTDIKNKGTNGQEIIEIEILGEYDYFFYVRKYFDASNNTAKNERKINDFDISENNISLFYKNNDELLKNSKAKLSLYANGIKVPALILEIPNIDITNNSYIYWAGFCLDGKKGLKGINVINKLYENEPPRNICSG